jgi:DNA polymerase-3 subunit epsilon
MFASTLFDAPVAFLDVETTGSQPVSDRVIEIGLVAARAGELEYQWSTLVNPGVTIPAFIEHFTGITNEMTRAAPAFEDVAEELALRLEGRLVVAHNARFDYGFLRGEFRRAGREFHSRVACTLKLSRLLDPALPQHHLDALIRHHGLPCSARHRALPDAAALFHYWERLRQTRPIHELEAALGEITRRPATPPQLPSDIASDLPETHGVYRFYGEADALLYVGKANNIRERVFQHWRAATVDGKATRLFAETRRVDWTLTAGELGALLLEASTVRRHRPLYNRRLRGGESWSWLVRDAGEPPVLVALDWTTVGAGDLYGGYRTAADAKRALLAIAREERLCLKVLGLEGRPGAPSGSCFGYQLGRCSGVCVGREPAALHLARLKLALARQRLEPWPFPGRVGFIEANDSGLEQLHVVDQWYYLGTVTRGAEPPPARIPAPFDFDTYCILRRWLARTPAARRVAIDAGGA